MSAELDEYIARSVQVMEASVAFVLELRKLGYRTFDEAWDGQLKDDPEFEPVDYKILSATWEITR